MLGTGVTNQPLSPVTLSFTDSAVSPVWGVNDEITFQLWDAAEGAPLSQTSTNAFRGASFSALPTVSATNGVDSTYYGLTLAKGATSSVMDELILTFKKDAPQDSHTTVFTISTLTVTLGSLIPAGHRIQLKVTASNGSPFAGGTTLQYTDAGIVPGMALTVSATKAAPPGTQGVGLGVITLKDATGGSVAVGDEIDLTLTGGSYSGAGVATGGLVATSIPTAKSVSRTNDTLTVTAKKTSVVGDSLTLSSVALTLPSSSGEVWIIAKDATTSTLLGAVGVAVSVETARVGGADRYSTTSQLYDLEFSSRSVAVLASGTNYPDALSAVYLARQLGTGVLTTDPNTLSAATRAELATGPIATVYVVGGPNAVSENVVAQVESLHVTDNPAAPNIQVIRVAGEDRYETNQKVNTYMASGSSATAIITTGQNFADALAVAPAVYATGDPLILVEGDTLSTTVKTTLDTLGVTHAVIVGGTNAVSFALELALADAGVTVDYRISGTDRTETAADLATWETDGLPRYDRYEALGGLGFSGTNVVNVARGDGFADALAVGPVAGNDESVIVLTAGPDNVGAGVPAYFAGRAGTTQIVRAIGLTDAISNLTLDHAAAALTEPLSF